MNPGMFFPQRSAVVGKGLYDVFDDIVHPIGDLLTSVADRIPGGQWIKENANSAVKALAKTADGQLVLAIISQGLTGVALRALTPVVGPTLATVAFAIPGLVAGDTFAHSWWDEWTLRLKELAESYGKEQVKERSLELEGAAKNPLLANLTEQGLDRLMQSAGVANPQAALAWANLRPEDLALQYGGHVDVWAAFLNAKTHRNVYDLKDYALGTGKTENPFAPPVPKGQDIHAPTGQGGGLGIFATSNVDQGLAFAAHAFDAPTNQPSPVAPHPLRIAAVLALTGAVAYGAYRYLRRR